MTIYSKDYFDFTPIAETFSNLEENHQQNIKDRVYDEIDTFPLALYNAETIRRICLFHVVNYHSEYLSGWSAPQIFTNAMHLAEYIFSSLRCNCGECDRCTQKSLSRQLDAEFSRELCVSEA